MCIYISLSLSLSIYIYIYIYAYLLCMFPTPPAEIKPSNMIVCSCILCCVSCFMAYVPF